MQGSAADSNYDDILLSEFLGWMPVKPSYDVPENFWKMWVFWSEPDDPRFSETINNWSVASRIRSALSEFNLLFCPIMLVQFWSPETVGDRRVLSTSRQPFALPAFRRGLCRYRVHSLKYKFIVDDQEQQDRNINPSTHDVSGEEEEVVVGGAVLVGGPPNRVFSSHLPEYSLDVRSYSIKDHPLLETANLHNLPAAYFTLPVFEPHTENCAGLLEIVLLDNIYLDISGVLPEIKRSLEVAGCIQEEEEVNYMNDPGSYKGGQVPSFGADIRYVHDMTANDTPTFQNISPMRSVTMEAAYGDYTIRFRLSTSSTATDLNEEIIKRLQPLRDRPYSITYEDDKCKQILIACDEDLQDLIMSRSYDDEIKILVSAITTTNQAPVQNESGLTVKASDGNETIKFQLSSSSTFASVEDKIAKSLDLVTGTFRLKYEDEEDELISIKNDEDLRECMSSSRGLNRTTIRMSVQRLENR